MLPEFHRVLPSVGRVGVGWLSRLGVDGLDRTILAKQNHDRKLPVDDKRSARRNITARMGSEAMHAQVQHEGLEEFGRGNGRSNLREITYRTVPSLAWRNAE